MSSATSPACAAAAAISSGLVTSSRIASTPRCCLIAEGFLAPAYTLRAPRANSSRVNAKPIPRLAPVTRATVLLIFMEGSYGLDCKDKYDDHHILGEMKSDQLPLAASASYWLMSALRAPASRARPSSLSPKARASWSDPTSVPATRLAAARCFLGSRVRTPAISRCTRPADASRTVCD